MKTTVQEGIAGTTLRYLDRALHLPSVVVLREEHAGPRVWAASGTDLAITTKDQAILTWVFANGRLAGRGTRTLEASEFCFVPICSKDRCMGAVGIRFDYGLLLPHERVLVSAVANLAAVALDNLETQTSGSGEKRA